MKPTALRIECLLAEVEAEVARQGLRPRRYAFHPDEVAEAEAQGLPYALVPRVLSKQEWLERYATPGAEAEFYARLRGGPVAFTRPGQPVAPAAPKPSAPGPQHVKPAQTASPKILVGFDGRGCRPAGPWVGPRVPARSTR